MADPRGTQQNLQDYVQGRNESQNGPLMNFFAENAGYGAQQNQQDYNNINQGYDTIMGLPGPSGPMDPRQAQSFQGNRGSGQPTSNTMPIAPQQGGQAPDQNTIMSLFPNGMTPEALKAAEPKLQAMGIHLQNEARGDLRPRMLMPDGRTVDLGDWGGKAQWQDRGNIGDWHAAYANGARGDGGGTGQPQGAGGGMSTFGSFATNGGYSPQDIANMRARGMSPIRAAYENAQREVGRQRTLQGGYAPNAIATLAKMARERGQASADAAQNVDAGIATARNQGKQFGLTGMSGALQGKSSLYGATPGMASTFGNQALTAAGQGVSGGNSILDAGAQISNIPGKFQDTASKIGTIANTAGAVANAIRPRK